MTDTPTWQPFDLPDAEIALLPHWLDAAEADALFDVLYATIPWEIHRIRLFGREVDSPRLSCWIGDEGASYIYSRRRFEPRPWPCALAVLRERLEQTCGARFNSVLANLYRDGNDSMGWHSDDEPELGTCPLIASLSLGAARRFRLRRKPVRGSQPTSADTLSLSLPHGSLLRMAGSTQQCYRHALPKTAASIGARINLTFRQIRFRQIGPLPHAMAPRQL